MEIRPVSLDQIVLGRDGRRYEVSGEAGRVAARLRELDPSLRVQFNEGGMFFAVGQLVDAGGNAVPTEDLAVSEKLVGRFPANEWDDRVVKDFEMRAFEVRNGMSAAARLDALDAQRDKATMDRLEQEVGERSYDLFRAFQRDLGVNPRVFIPARKKTPELKAA